MAVAALRPDRAARPLRRREFRPLPKPYRSFRAGTVFRNEKPGPGRFRQFMQFDADTVGAARVAADAEMCMMAADTLERARHRARRLRHQGQQPQGARRGDGGDRARRAGERGPAAHRAAGDGQVRQVRRGGRAPAARRRAQGRERRLHQGRGARRRSRSAEVLAVLDAKGRRQREHARAARPAFGDAARARGRRGAARDRAISSAAMPTASASTRPSCAASNITPARSSRPS